MDVSEIGCIVNSGHCLSLVTKSLGLGLRVFQNWLLEANVQSVNFRTVLSLGTSVAALKQRTAGKCLIELRSI